MPSYQGTKSGYHVHTYKFISCAQDLGWERNVNRGTEIKEQGLDIMYTHTYKFISCA